MTEKFMDIERFIPVLDRIVIQEIETKDAFNITQTENKTASGIIIASDSNEYSDELAYGKVLAKGEDVKKYDLNIGDIIAYRALPKKYGVPIKNYNNGTEKYRLLTEVDVYMIIEKE